MSNPERPAPGAPSTLTCGNCGVAVGAGDVTCPSCGVLLAAYQAPAGATASDTSATRAVIPPGISSTPAPEEMDPESLPDRPAMPVHQPRSQSPIGDALRRSRDSRTTSPGDVGSAEAADELARMATSDSALAREVEAELAGAKVTFDGDAAVIETDQVELTHTPEGEPVVAGHGQATANREADIPVTESRVPSESSTVAPPQPVHPPAGRSAIPTQGQRPSTGRLDPSTIVRWIPFILIGCAVLGIGRSLPGFGGIIGFALVIGLVYLLVKVAAASSRKTTSMPRDDRWNTPRSRRRK